MSKKYIINGVRGTAKELSREFGKSITTIKRYSLKDAYLYNKKTKKVIRANPQNINLIVQELNVKKKKAKQIIGGQRLRGWTKYDKIPEKKLIDTRIRFSISWTDSYGNKKTRRRAIIDMKNSDPDFQITKKDLRNNEETETRLIEYANENYGSFIGEYGEDVTVKIFNIRSGYQNLNFEDMELREDTYIELFNRELKPFECEDFVKEYSKKKKIQKIIDPVTCIKRYLLLNYSKQISQKYLEQFDVITLKTLKKICNDKNIVLKAYDTTGKIQAENYLIDKQSKCKHLCIVVYNNHLYPIDDIKVFNKRKEIKHKNTKKISYIHYDKINDKLIEILNNDKVMPHLHFQDDKIVRIDYDGMTYVINDEYKNVFMLLKDHGLKDRYYPTMKMCECLKLIFELYTPKQIKYSYAPELNKLKKSDYYYYNDKIKIDGQTVTIDKNKCYSWVLTKLPFLPFFDCSEHTITPVEGIILNENYYNVTIDECTLLFPQSFIYSGLYINMCQKICPFIKLQITHELQCGTNENYYSDMIDTLYTNYDNDMLKGGMNKLIGKMASSKDAENMKLKFVKICNEDESKRYDGDEYFIKKIDDEYYSIFDVTYEHKPHINNEVLVNFMVKDFARLEIFKIINENNIEQKDIIQIKVDSISFRKKKGREYDFEIDKSDYTKWKTENFRALKSNKKFFDEPLTLFTNWNKKEYKPVFNSLGGYYDGLAGCGKTEFIIKNILPKLRDDYFIVTPQHANNIEYLKKGLKSKVMQTFLFFGNQTIKENNIIVDEVGLFDGRMRKKLYEWYLQGKKIFLFGDNRQLEPVCGTDIMINAYLLKKMSNNNYYMFHSNWRNTYSQNEYMNMLEGKLTKKQMMNYILEHNNKKINRNSDTVICFYTTDKKDYVSSTTKYNNKLMKKRGFKEISDIGCKVICKSNKLNKQSIFNNFILYVVKKTEEDITLTDEYKLQSYIIKLTDFHKFFIAGYARSLHSIQGSNLENYKICTDDKDLRQFMKPRAIYTLLSRFKDNKCVGDYGNQEIKPVRILTLDTDINELDYIVTK